MKKKKTIPSSVIFSLGAGVTPAQGSVKPTSGFTFDYVPRYNESGPRRNLNSRGPHHQGRSVDGQAQGQGCNCNGRESRHRQGNRGTVRQGRREGRVLGAHAQRRRASAGRLARNDGRWNQESRRRGGGRHLRCLI